MGAPHGGLWTSGEKLNLDCPCLEVLGNWTGKKQHELICSDDNSDKCEG